MTVPDGLQDRILEAVASVKAAADTFRPNKNLNTVKCAGNETVYVAGHDGILIRGRENIWEIIDHEEPLTWTSGACNTRLSYIIGRIRAGAGGLAGYPHFSAVVVLLFHPDRDLRPGCHFPFPGNFPPARAGARGVPGGVVAAGSERRP